MILTRYENDEVLYPDEDCVTLSISDIDELKHMAIMNPRQRIRLCAHQHPKHKLHEMFIVHTKDCYVRPHKHLSKIESISILEGEADVILFNDNGKIEKIIEMSAPILGKKFFHRMEKPIYHTLLIHSDFLVFHEITEGPFITNSDIFPEWAPKEDESEIKDYISKIQSLVEKHKRFKFQK